MNKTKIGETNQISYNQVLTLQIPKVCIHSAMTEALKQSETTPVVEIPLKL